MSEGVHLYVLCHEGQQVVETHYPVWGASKVMVRAGRWYDARAKCIAHALDAGHAKIAIVVGTVYLLHRPHWNGLGERTVVSRMNEYGHHGLWVYVDRLLRRFGHVYVPPLSAMRTWEVEKKHPWRYINNPVIPSVAGYTMQALATLRDHTIPFGKLLCGNGYDSVTISDYYHHNLGDTVLDENGSASTWNQAYERAIDRLC